MRFPRAGRHSLLPGGSGRMPGRHHDRSATVIAGRGQAGAGNARLLAKSPEVHLELSGGVSSLPQVPRWNAVRRARCASARAAPVGAETNKYAPGGVLPPFISFFRSPGEQGEPGSKQAGPALPVNIARVRIKQSLFGRGIIRPRTSRSRLCTVKLGVPATPIE